MHAWTDGWMNRRINGCIDGWIDGLTNLWMDEWLVGEELVAASIHRLIDQDAVM